MNNKEQAIQEINATIQEIEKSLKPGCEIGAKDKTTLLKLLQTSKTTKKPKFFKCRRENSDRILTYFVKEKGVTQNKFSSKLQEYIYLL